MDYANAAIRGRRSNAFGGMTGVFCVGRGLPLLEWKGWRILVFLASNLAHGRAGENAGDVDERR